MLQYKTNRYNGEIYTPTNGEAIPLPAIAQASQQIDIFNYTYTDIVVGYRSGETAVLKPLNTNRNEPVVMIRIKLSTGQYAKYYSPNYTNEELKKLNTVERALANRTATNAIAVNRNAEAQYTYIMFPLDTILQNNGSVYSDALDIVLSVHGHGYGVHPYSFQGRQERHNKMDELNIDPMVLSQGFNLHVWINDPITEGDNKYITIGEDTYAVSVSNLPEYAIGVYISFTNQNGETVTEHFELNEVEKLKKARIVIHDSKAEAEKTKISVLTQQIENDRIVLQQHLTDAKRVSSELDSRRKEQEHEIAMREIERKEQADQSAYILRLEEDRRKAQAEQQKLIEDRDKHKRELEALERKDYYGERSAQRKDSSELFKVIPTVFTVGAALIALGTKLGK